MDMQTGQSQADSIGNILQLPCDFCSEVFTSVQSLAEHIEKEHPARVSSQQTEKSGGTSKPSRRYKISPETIRNMRADRKSGMSGKDVADKNGVSVSMVWKYTGPSGPPARKFPKRAKPVPVRFSPQKNWKKLASLKLPPLKDLEPEPVKKPAFDNFRDEAYALSQSLLDKACMWARDTGFKGDWIRLAKSACRLAAEQADVLMDFEDFESEFPGVSETLPLVNKINPPTKKQSKGGRRHMLTPETIKTIHKLYGTKQASDIAKQLGVHVSSVYKYGFK